MSDVSSLAPMNSEQQIGFDNAFLIISLYWRGVMETHSDDSARVFQMDTFMAGVMAKLSGYSNEESYIIVDGLRNKNLFDKAPE